MSPEIDKVYLALLYHMLGAGPRTKKSSWGRRNMFCAGVNTVHHEQMQAMEKLGLVAAGQTINDSTSQYFHATLAGCQAAGLHKSAISRAFGKA